MNLVIDIGNTHAKIAVFDKDELVEVVCDSNRNLSHLHEISRKYPLERAIVVTVVDIAAPIRTQFRYLTVPLLWLDHTTALPIENLYETPLTLGYDRIAAAIAANRQCPDRNLLIIDAGTCITYEFVDASNRYQGGNISPGLQMRFRALRRYTSQLPLVSPEGRELFLGKDTDTAIRSGVIEGIKFEMEGYIRAMKQKYPDLLVFLTGGDDFSFDTKLKSVIFADKFLVLRGLNHILNYNFKVDACQ